MAKLEAVDSPDELLGRLRLRVNGAPAGRGPWWFCADVLAFMQTWRRPRPVLSYMQPGREGTPTVVGSGTGPRRFNHFSLGEHSPNPDCTLVDLKRDE